MSTKHTVTLPDGTIGKRTSANRVYPFAVAVGPMPRAELVEILERRIIDEKAYLVNYREVLAYVQAGGELVQHRESIFATGLLPAKSSSHFSRSLGQRDVGWTFGTNKGRDLAEVVVESYSDYLGRGESALTKHELALKAAIEGPALIGTWTVHGWQSRDDLARKELDKVRGYFRGRDVAIVESVFVTK